MKLSLPRLALFVTLFALLFGAVGSAWAARRDDSLPVEEYWALLKSSRQTVADLDGKTDEEIRAALDDLAAQWDAVASVQLESGETLPVDNSHITSALRAENPDLDKLTALLDSILASRATDPEPRFTKDDIQPLTEILARPEFQWKEEQSNPLDDWLQRMWDRFAAWLDKLIPDFTIAIDPTPIAAILLVLILLYAFRGLFVDLIADARLNANGDADDELLTADSAFQRAQSLSRGGDYRAAVRYLYLSSLLMLDERGLLRYDRSRTNREVLRSVADQPELSQPLSEVVDVFDNVWYGYHELDEDTFKHYSDRVEELKDKKQ